MTCPDEAVLTVHASAPDELWPGEGWSAARLAGHLAGCPACRGKVGELRRSIEALWRVDLVDAGRYDESWMEELAQQVEAGLEVEATADVVPLRGARWRVPALLTVAATAALLVVGLWLIGPPATTTSEELTVAANPLAEQGRLLGRSLLETALDEEDEGGVLASALDTDTLLEDLVDEQWSFQTTLDDELDELTTDELRSLSLRL